MNTIKYHIKGITTTAEELLKGKFLVYFVPGIVITILYYAFLSVTKSYQDAIDLSTGYSWIDSVTGLVESGIDSFFSLIQFLFEQVYIFVVLTLLSPFNTSLGEKLDGYLTGASFKFDLLRFLNDMFRMIFVVLIIVTLEFTFILLYYIISWLFGLDLIDEIVYFIIAAFFFGFSFYDFSLERYEKGVGSSIAYAFNNMLTMILTGSIFLLIYKIPIIGIPASVVLTVMISTVVYLYKEKKLPVQSDVTKSNQNEQAL